MESLRRLHRRLLTAIIAGVGVVALTGFHLLYLARTDVQSPAAVIYFVMSAGLIAALIAFLFRQQRRIERMVRHDVKSLMRLANDVRTGNVRVDYPTALADFREAFEFLRKSGKRLVEEKERLKDMGLVDHLSQLGNRRHFETRLKEIHEMTSTHGVSSVLIIDMDKFKQVNDQHGHDAGDALIVAFANALRKNVRQTDVLARLGGDEFCVIYPYTPLDKARVLAERLRKQMPREVELVRGIRHPLRWTGGLSVMAESDRTSDDVLWRADQALLKSKEAGRNLTLTFDPVSGPEKVRRIVSCS